jgi:type VI secretion system protein ImpM
MSRADLIPGFYGKLPAAGDFVARGLPDAFVRRWDRWLSRHLARRLGRAWPATGLRFLHPGPVTGVVVPSADRAGRAFPLTLAATAPPQPAAWYDALAALAASTASPAALEAALARHPATEQGHAAPGLLLWTTGHPAEADPDAPGALLDALLPEPAATGQA